MNHQRKVYKISRLLEELHSPLNQDSYKTLHELYLLTDDTSQAGVLTTAAGLTDYLQQRLRAERAATERQLVLAQLAQEASVPPAVS